MASDAWVDSFVENAVDFLSQHFGVSSPRVGLNCEEACGWADKCHYAACYMPWLNQVNFKSGSEQGVIVSHEFGHRLQQAGLLEEGEKPAILMEEWWAKNMNELSCEVCGAPLFISEQSGQGTEVTCEGCGSVYEAVSLHGMPEGDAGFKFGFVVGLGLGAIVFTSVGRELVKTAAGITEAELRRRIEATKSR